MDPDPGGPKTCGSGRSGTLEFTTNFYQRFSHWMCQRGLRFKTLSAAILFNAHWGNAEWEDITAGQRRSGQSVGCDDANRFYFYCPLCYKTNWILAETCLSRDALLKDGGNLYHCITQSLPMSRLTWCGKTWTFRIPRLISTSSTARGNPN